MRDALVERLQTWNRDVVWLLRTKGYEIEEELGLGNNAGTFLYKDIRRQKKAAGKTSKHCSLASITFTGICRCFQVSVGLLIWIVGLPMLISEAFYSLRWPLLEGEESLDCLFALSIC